MRMPWAPPGCVRVTGLRGGARGRDTRRRRATDTAEPRAAVYTPTSHPRVRVLMRVRVVATCHLR
eukprot:6994124-Prymnesium_polylepis.2